MLDGIVSMQTSIQTTAVATIKRHNSSSPWSSHPGTSKPNPLFAKFIEIYWGAKTAQTVMQHILETCPVPPKGGRKSTRTSNPDASVSVEARQDERRENQKPKTTVTEETVRPDSATSTSTAPAVPRRRTSLRRLLGSPLGHRGQLPEDDTDRESNVSFGGSTLCGSQQPLARDTTDQPRATEATGSWRSRHLSRIRRVSPTLRTSSSTTGGLVSPPPSTPVQNETNNTTASIGAPSARSPFRAQTARERTPRGWGLRGSDEALVALTPVVADARNEGSSGQARRTGAVAVTPTRAAGRTSSVKTRRPKEREKGWSWAWW